MKAMRISLLCLVLVVLSISVGHAQEQQWNLTFKGGPLIPGTVTIDPPGGDVDTDMGWLLNAYIDAMVAPKLSFGGFLLLAGTSASGGGTDSGATVATLGATVKGRFTLQNGMQLRPGLAIGYQMISGDAFDGVKGLDVGGIFEIVKPLANNKNALVGEVGFITQPAGGNSDADVTFGPIFYLAFGYEFGG
ncbi:MAG: hypothetical protein NTW97_11600 [Candidatus Krumholzibacteria bacterium]|nr:hypothetical protein [Candidatus Krumholzibacteria bacterium]